MQRPFARRLTTFGLTAGAILLTNAIAVAGSIRNDYTVTGAPPAIAGFPSATGGSYFDPVFGSKISRVTTTGSCEVPYASWSVFNADSSKLYVECSGGFDHLFTLNKTYDFQTGLTSVQSYVGGVNDSVADGEPVNVEIASASWSHTNPNIIYFLGGPQGLPSTRLYRVDISQQKALRFGSAANETSCSITNSLGCLKDFDTLFTWATAPGCNPSEQPHVVGGLQMSEDEKVFSVRTDPTDNLGIPTLCSADMSTTIPTTTQVGTWVLNNGQDTFYSYGGDPNIIHRNLLTQGALASYTSFTYLVSQASSDYLWTSQGGSSPGSAINFDQGHQDIGRTWLITGNTPDTGIDRIDFPNLGVTNILDFRNCVMPLHCFSIDVSQQSIDEKVAYISTFTGTSTYTSHYTTDPFDNEMVLAYTNNPAPPSTQYFARIAHIRSEITDSATHYDHQPKAAVDRLGRYIAFTSDMTGPNGTTNSSSLFDVWLVKIPQPGHPTVGGVSSVGDTGKLFHIDQTGHVWRGNFASGYTLLPSPTTFVGGIARVATSALGYAYDDAFAIGSDGHLWDMYWLTSGWQANWRDLGAPPCGSAVGNPIGSSLNGTVTVAVRCANGDIATRWYDTVFSTWRWSNYGHPVTRLGQAIPLASDPALLRGPSGWYVYVVGTDDNLWWYSSQSGNWTMISGKPAAHFTGAPGATGTSQQVLVGTSNGDSYAVNSGTSTPTWTMVAVHNNCGPDGDIATTPQSTGSNQYFAVRCSSGNAAVVWRYDGTAWTARILTYAQSGYPGNMPLSQPTMGTDANNDPWVYLQTSAGEQLSFHLSADLTGLSTFDNGVANP